MTALENLKATIAILPIPQETKDLFISSSEILYNFRTFISSKYEITMEDADAKISAAINLSTSNILELNPEDVAENNRVYAESEGYEDSEKLKTAIINFYNCAKSLQK
jgi:hypothetical protein